MAGDNPINARIHAGRYRPSFYSNDNLDSALDIDVDRYGQILLGINATISKFDYVSRTDSNPVYVGTAPMGSQDIDNAWTIQQFQYDASARITVVETLFGQWSNRASLGWY